ncbi:uncharacterized protein LOC141858573 [Brevipalpus obovatus]|uniref:uncharacterized protein LOC141858573 n=1 Tax=Brevipalpus obovatus TaxID=246614 RepID=UPI003D9F2753
MATVSEETQIVTIQSLVDDESDQQQQQQLHLTVLNPMVVNSTDDCYTYTIVPNFPLLPSIVFDEVENENPDHENDDVAISSPSPPLSSTSSSSYKDPFRPECRIPLPGMLDDVYIGLDNRTIVRRRNERERTRVRNVNEGFERLRQHLPSMRNQKEKRLSKVETLREAINYIRYLQNQLSKEDCHGQS